MPQQPGARNAAINSGAFYDEVVPLSTNARLAHFFTFDEQPVKAKRTYSRPETVFFAKTGTFPGTNPRIPMGAAIVMTREALRKNSV